MAILKGDIVNGAYSRMRISGITSIPTAGDNKLALGRLESMAARWFNKNICAGYVFEDSPDMNTPSGISAGHRDAFETNLAVQIIPDFNKQTHPVLAAISMASYNDLANDTAKTVDLQYSNRVPRGRGSRRYSLRSGSNYFYPIVQTPIDCATNDMVIGNIDDFTEPFIDYLGTGEDVFSYTLEATAGLTVSSQSLSTPDVLYRIEAVGGSDETGGLQNVQIVATTTTGRITTRVIYFNLIEVN